MCSWCAWCRRVLAVSALCDPTDTRLITYFSTWQTQRETLVLKRYCGWMISARVFWNNSSEAKKRIDKHILQIRNRLQHDRTKEKQANKINVIVYIASLLNSLNQKISLFLLAVLCESFVLRSRPWEHHQQRREEARIQDLEDELLHEGKVSLLDNTCIATYSAEHVITNDSRGRGSFAEEGDWSWFRSGRCVVEVGVHWRGVCNEDINSLQTNFTRKRCGELSDECLWGTVNHTEGTWHRTSGRRCEHHAACRKNFQTIKIVSERQ
mgnify:CR=1 FL=1